MKHDDPRHLVEPASGAPALLREALASARADVPSAQAMAALAARLPLGGGGGGGGGGARGGGARGGGNATTATPPHGAAAIAAPPSTLSGALIGAALGALVSGVGLIWSAQTETAPAPAPMALVATARPLAPALPPPTERDAPADPPPPAEVAQQPENAAPKASAAAAASAPPAASAAASVEASSAPETPAADAETEAHLLERARDALAASPARALALTEEHAARFHGGALAQEREVVAIQALAKLGRTDEARARAARFESAYPGSAHLRRLDAMLSR